MNVIYKIYLKNERWLSNTIVIIVFIHIEGLVVFKSSGANFGNCRVNITCMERNPAFVE